MSEYMTANGGFLQDPRAQNECQFCQIDSTDQFLLRVNANWETRWRDFGLLWVYIGVNVAGAIFFYWLFRVPKGKKSKGKKM